MQGSSSHTDEVVRDRALVERVLNGDRQAFADLYRVYEQRVYAFCLRTCGNPDDAADATHEAFATVLRRLPDLDPKTVNFGGYLFVVSRNASLRVAKRHNKAHPEPELPEPDRADPISAEEDPERALLVADQQRLVSTANGRLAPRQRQALALREIEGMSYAEIGGILGIRPNAVAQLISRARLRLKEEVRGASTVRPLATDDCYKALPLLSKRVDGELDVKEEEWLTRHLEACDACRANLEAVEEAGVTYRSWIPGAPAPILAEVFFRDDAIAALLEQVGAERAGQNGESAADRNGDGVDAGAEMEAAAGSDGGAVARSDGGTPASPGSSRAVFEASRHISRASGFAGLHRGRGPAFSALGAAALLLILAAAVTVMGNGNLASSDRSPTMLSASAAAIGSQNVSGGAGSVPSELVSSANKGQASLVGGHGFTEDIIQPAPIFGVDLGDEKSGEPRESVTGLEPSDSRGSDQPGQGNADTNDQVSSDTQSTGDSVSAKLVAPSGPVASTLGLPSRSGSSSAAGRSGRRRSGARGRSSGRGGRSGSHRRTGGGSVTQPVASPPPSSSSIFYPPGATTVNVAPGGSSSGRDSESGSGGDSGSRDSGSGSRDSGSGSGDSGSESRDSGSGGGDSGDCTQRC